MKRAVALAGLLVVLSPPAPAQEPAVRAWESPLRVPTYPVGPAEPNPMFFAGREYQGAQGPVYPYPLLDRLLDQREDRAYRALWLENEYLKLSILPEIGGRIFTAQDKTNGYDFFYRQRVIKPALIGMLGAWISGGVEWNVFHHHRATTFMPVQSAITENADGSRTVWVGETEWRQRMRWVVGLTVRPGRLVRGGGGPHDEPHAARPLDALLLEPRGPHERRLPGALPAGRGLGHLPRQDRLRPLAAGARAVRGPRLRARHGPQLVEEPPLPDLLLRLPFGEGLPRRLRPRQARGRRARGRPRHDAGQEVLDLGERARRTDVGQDPHRRGRAVHRAHDRRLLRQPARLLVDPAGRDAHGRALLVPGARAGRGEGREPRGRPQPRGEGRQGPPRRQHHDAATGRAGAPPRRRPGRLRDDGHDRPRRALRARGCTPRRHPGGGPAPRRPRGGWDGAGGVRGPPATEDRRAEALRAASAARPGEDRGGAVPRGPAARAVPQPALRPGGLLPRGAAPRPRRRPHEHGPRRPRPAPGPLRRSREAPHGRGRAPDREPHPREERRGAVRPGPRPRGPREDRTPRARPSPPPAGTRPTPAPPRSRRRGSSRRAATPPAPSTSSTAPSAPMRATPPPCR